MRVISGHLRGTKLKGVESISTRPTLDRVKESLFNIISYKLQDACVLDLFAGSGALAIEALSRGAKHAIINDYDKRANLIILDNLKKTKLEDKTKVTTLDYKELLKTLKGQKFDIIFVDPPYEGNMKIDAIRENKRI